MVNQIKRIMKELSIEQKAKRYDEAKYIMKEYLESGNAGVIAENTIKKAFPELKESEDERIRKELLQIAKESEDSFYMVMTPDKRKHLIAWLEKQGNANKEYWRGYREGKQEILDKYAELEKQGEQKPDTNCLLSWSETDEKMFQSLEGIVKDYWAKAEQEKNEIKIREASNVSYFLKTIQKSPLCWIKCSDGLPNKDGIYLVVTDGRHNDVYDMARYDSIEGWHKASEIIYWMPIPQLNNKSIIEQKPTDTDNKFIRMRETKPKDISEFLDRLTTVEQEFLWEHIAKIRELDKEEKKPAVITPKFRIGDYVKNVNDKREPIYEIVYMDKECYVCEYRGKENMGDKAVMHFAFDNPYLRLVEQNPVDNVEKPWSEEDEGHIYTISNILEDRKNQQTEVGIKILDKEIAWLNYLKNRIQPQSQWKPSDKDIFELQCVINNDPYNGFILKALLEQLKKLRG